MSVMLSDFAECLEHFQIGLHNVEQICCIVLASVVEGTEKKRALTVP